jgi:hypothetical protein
MFAQLAFRRREIEREQLPIAAALEPRRRLVLVRDVAFQARPQIGPETSLLRVVTGEELLLDRSSEESLRQILGIVRRARPLDADKFVDRLPVSRDQRLEAPASLALILTAGGDDCGEPGAGELHCA